MKKKEPNNIKYDLLKDIMAWESVNGPSPYTTEIELPGWLKYKQEKVNIDESERMSHGR
jgi:hypothetical protein